MTIAITNIEQTTDELHGFGLLDYNINLVVDPGETKTVTFTREEGRLPVLLHELLLGAAPGDAGLPDREAEVTRSTGAVCIGSVPLDGTDPTTLRPSAPPSSSSRTPRARCSAARLLLVLVAALLPYFLPLWNLTMFAPQYPDGLRLDIFSHALVGGSGGQDMKEINLLNHYIGMHDLAAEDFTEFQWMPFVLGALALLFLRAAVLGTVKELLDVDRPVRLLRRVLPVVVRLQALSLRARPGADGGRQGAGVHAAGVRLSADRQLRGLLVSAGGHVSARRRRPAARGGSVLAWRARDRATVAVRGDRCCRPSLSGPRAAQAPAGATDPAA